MLDYEFDDFCTEIPEATVEHAMDFASAGNLSKCASLLTAASPPSED
jgi:hypothetical protein